MDEGTGEPGSMAAANKSPFLAEIAVARRFANLMIARIWATNSKSYHVKRRSIGIFYCMIQLCYEKEGGATVGWALPWSQKVKYGVPLRYCSSDASSCHPP